MYLLALLTIQSPWQHGAALAMPPVMYSVGSLWMLPGEVHPDSHTALCNRTADNQAQKPCTQKPFFQLRQILCA